MKIYTSPISFGAIRVDNKITDDTKQIEANLLQDLPSITEIAFLKNYDAPRGCYHSFIIKGLPKRVEPAWCEKIKEFGLTDANIVSDERISRTIQFQKIDKLRPSFLEESFIKFTDNLRKSFSADETRRILGAIYEAAEMTERQTRCKSIRLNPEILDLRVARRLLETLEKECSRLNKELYISEKKLKDSPIGTSSSVIDKMIQEAKEKVEKLQSKKLTVMTTAGFYVNILNMLQKQDFLNKQQIHIITLLKNALEDSPKSKTKVSLDEIKDNIITTAAEMAKTDKNKKI